MKNRLILGLILASFNLLVACSDNTPELAKLPRDAVILAFGNSLTHGTGTKLANSYPAVLENLSGHKVINAGIPGELSEQGLKRLPGLLQKHKPELLILCHAGNDILRKRNLDSAANNLMQMITLARENNTEVILIGVPEPGLFLRSSKLYSSVAEQTNVLFIDDLIPEILSDASLKSDPIHPNKEGYKIMAQTLLDIMKEAGAL
jgi:lysophospholipase L1-like esterase